jgi:hypothetical protein
VFCAVISVGFFGCSTSRPTELKIPAEAADQRNPFPATPDSIAQGNIVPIYFAYQADRLHGFTTLGRKVEWMRSNPLVCVEVDEVVSHFLWSSVVVLGHYEELPDTPEYKEARLQAEAQLEKRALWWQTAYAAGQAHNGPRPATALLWRAC